MTTPGASAAELDAGIRTRLLDWAAAMEAVAADARQTAGEDPPALTADVRVLLAGVLRDHYLTGITCDHRMNADNPVCACSRVDLGWHPTVGDAVQAWIDHVLGVLYVAGGGQ